MHTKMHTSRKNRGGFTLIEMMIALTVFTILGAVAIQMFVSQTRAVYYTAGRTDAENNAVFAADFIDHDLRVAGQGVVTTQPVLVEIGPNGMAFNADIVTNDTATVTTASYYDPSVPDSLTLAIPASSAVALQQSGTAYPATTYYQSTGVLSNAELLQYWVVADPTQPVASKLYVMYRRVNDGPSVLLAKNILIRATDVAPFQYYKDSSYTGNTNPYDQLYPVTTGFPYTFTVAATHADTILTKIREVEVRLNGVFTDPRGNQTIRDVDNRIRIPNLGLPEVASCGTTVAAPATLTATVGAVGSGIINLAWPASTDETSGALDVRVYLVYRRLSTTPATQWGTPLLTIPSGSTTYAYSDTPPVGSAYYYGVVAQNCTPSVSPITQQTGAAVTPP
jgi:prepilin-type N-terminal cleavage/methylation domain-containing protein